MDDRREVGVTVDDHSSLELPHHPLRAKLPLANRQPDLDAEPTKDLAGFLSVGRILQHDGEVPGDPNGRLDFLVDGRLLAS
jgi:hypothetical protein